MLTHNSPELTSTTWSPVIARPRWPVTSSTPGIARSSWLAVARMRAISGRDVPGVAVRRATTSRSLNDGITGPFISGISAIAASTATAAPAMTQRGRAARPVSTRP